MYLTSLGLPLDQPFHFLGNGDARPDLEISKEALTSYDWAFKQARGKTFKDRIEKAAKMFGLNPGQLAENLLSEAVPAGRGVYLETGRVFSPAVGADYFYETFFVKEGPNKGKTRRSSTNKAPAFKKIKFDSSWDRKNPPQYTNEAGNTMDAVWLASGWDAMLAHAAYLKFFEGRLREEAKAAGKDFDALPAELRFFLVRIRFNPGKEKWKAVLKDALDGKDVIAPKGRDKPKWPSIRRAATVHAARAVYVSDKIFGVKP